MEEWVADREVEVRAGWLGVEVWLMWRLGWEGVANGEVEQRMVGVVGGHVNTFPTIFFPFHHFFISRF